MIPTAYKPLPMTGPIMKPAPFTVSKIPCHQQQVTQCHVCMLVIVMASWTERISQFAQPSRTLKQADHLRRSAPCHWWIASPRWRTLTSQTRQNQCPVGRVPQRTVVWTSCQARSKVVWIKHNEDLYYKTIIRKSSLYQIHVHVHDYACANELNSPVPKQYRAKSSQHDSKRVGVPHTYSSNLKQTRSDATQHRSSFDIIQEST